MSRFVSSNAYTKWNRFTLGRFGKCLNSRVPKLNISSETKITTLKSSAVQRRRAKTDTTVVIIQV